MFFLKNHVEKVKIENIKSNEVYAPVEGEVIPLDEVDDAVFSEKILGDGVAVEPDKGEIYSPVKGTVSVVFPTKHVVGITTEEGANIILHIGIDTVELKGKDSLAYTRLVTHVKYFAQRYVDNKESMDEDELLDQTIKERFQREVCCIEGLSEMLYRKYGRPVTVSEENYLVLHLRTCVANKE